MVAQTVENWAHHLVVQRARPMADQKVDWMVASTVGKTAETRVGWKAHQMVDQKAVLSVERSAVQWEDQSVRQKASTRVARMAHQKVVPKAALWVDRRADQSVVLTVDWTVDETAHMWVGQMDRRMV
eukprot:CAMPEP_0114431186 /NCGR_PEP_ID=MMETSP0103-20121206/10462_1 /TAXON_ID=37642 ORGANISM="Paraphysomonas imperforata, Strain PA2" /NCGR_SAMPLE_ID=MMETSP0103 /ASSEMBLY_ACC=CAM_ASM_000201 /LENGTH=126 /DNA_ID=CAMNT_0001600727 /DNA_START=760 /DNA_END=1140 /DNA_ORIENTATION=-